LYPWDTSAPDVSKLQPGGIYVETTDVAAPSTETISVNVPVVPITTQIPDLGRSQRISLPLGGTPPLMS